MSYLGRYFRLLRPAFTQPESQWPHSAFLKEDLA
jgi:hypothetical protein